MRNTFRGGLLTGVLAVGLASVGLIGRPTTAVAQYTVTCVNCSSQMQQLIGYAQQLAQGATQASQYALQLQQFANMVQNTASIPTQIYSSAMSDMRAVQGLLSVGTQLSPSNTGASMGTFSSYLTSATAGSPSIATQSAQYATWANRSKDGISAAMSAMAAQNNQLSSDDATMNNLQSQTAGVTGQVQAMQNVAQIATQQVREMEKLRQLIMIMIQLEANKQQNASEAQAASQAQAAALGSFTPLDLNAGSYPQ
ncbi:MAG: P-type conjugative transfer protein TrbJ [Terracidiphilus sp.]|nr:P-type conjugative transfer protein TrbJ [Terracidiphilus sp.]